MSKFKNPNLIDRSLSLVLAQVGAWRLHHLGQPGSRPRGQGPMT